MRRNQSTWRPHLPILTFTFHCRSDFNELQDESGFVYSKEPKRGQRAPSSSDESAPLASSSKNTLDSVPVIRSSSGSGQARTQQTLRDETADRGTTISAPGPRLPRGPPTVPRRTISGSNRRTSLTFKTSRRSSNLRDGTAAHPHPGVPDKELYRHCADDMPPILRMQHLATWTLDRAKADALSAAPSPQPLSHRGKKPKRADSMESDGNWSSQDKLVLERCRASIEKVMAFTVRDLGEKKVNISWIGQTAATSKKSAPQPRSNPMNESNELLSSQLASLVASLRAEKARWEKEQESIEEYEDATAAMLRTTASAASTKDSVNKLLSSDATVPPRPGTIPNELSWTAADLGPEGSRRLQDAQRALALEKHWLLDDAPRSDLLQAAIYRAAEQQQAADDGLKAGANGEEEALALRGTDLDERWQDFEFQVDLLRSRTHSVDQLNLLTSSYANAISSRAAQALRQLAFGGRDSAESSGALSTNSGDGTTESRQIRRDRTEKLLRGIRESIGLARTEDVEDADETELFSAGGNATGRPSFLADQSAADLFKAFASTKPSTAKQTGRRSGMQ